MSVVEIADHLADPLALLTLAPRTAPARQQTMRAAIDWSYALLTPQEQTLLRRLAVFAGGFTLRAAQLVCSGPDLPPADVVDLLDRLVSKSLLIAVPDEETTRFVQLETVRSYLWQQLVLAGEEDALRARHRDWCLALAERVPAELLDSDQADRLAQEQANLRAALHWTLESDQGAEAARLAIGLTPLWLLRGSFAEGRAQLTAVAQLPSAAASPVLTSLAYSWAAVFAHNEGANMAAEDLAVRGLALAETTDDNLAVVMAMNPFAQAAFGQGNMALAAERAAAGLKLADRGGPAAATIAFWFSITMLELGDPDRAEQLLAEATRLAREAKFRFGEGRLLALQAIFAERARDHQLADQRLAEALAAERSRGGLPGVIDVLTMAGQIFVERGEWVRATDALSEALAAATFYGSHLRLARVLESLTGLLVETHPDASVRLAAGAQELRDSLRAQPRPSESHRLGIHLARAEQKLGHVAYMATWKAARAMPLDKIVDDVRKLLGQASPEAVVVPHPRPDQLTARQREVVLLVVRGLSNREIAEELVVTRKTAEAHIGNILNKLELSSRVQIATWAYARGLAEPETGAPATA